MSGLTKRQVELLAFMEGYDREHGVTPTYDEMRVALGLASKSGIHRMVQGLIQRGFLRRVSDNSRGLQIINREPILPNAHVLSRVSDSALEALANAVGVELYARRRDRALAVEIAP